MAKIAVVYHSGTGRTKQMAERVAGGAQKVKGAQVKLISTEEAIKDMGPLNEADCIIFGAPTYMGGASAQFKAFADATGGIWYKQGWKDKLAAGFTNSQGPSGDKLQTLQSMAILAMQHGMLWVGTGMTPGAENTAGTEQEINRLSSYLGAMAQTPYRAESPLAADLHSAEKFGARVAEAALRWAHSH